MKRQLLRFVGEVGALGAGLLVVNFVDVCGETLGSRRFVLTERARERLEVRVEVPLEAPVVDARPRAVAARVAPLTLQPILGSNSVTCLRHRVHVPTLAAPNDSCGDIDTVTNVTR